MPSLRVHDTNIDYKIVRSPRRKRLAVELSPDRSVIVRAPRRATQGDIERFVNRNRQRIFQWLHPDKALKLSTRRVETERGPIDFRLVRRKGRKRIAIVVVASGAVEVRAAPNLPLGAIDDFVRAKAGWVAQHVQETMAVSPAAAAYRTGDTILFGGIARRLVVEPVDQGDETVVVEGHTLRVGVRGGTEHGDNRENVRRLLKLWLVHQAMQAVEERVWELARSIGVQPGIVRVKDMKSRWGSCSPARNISINSRLVMAPPEVLKYVMIHELCHIVHGNHSRDYWDLVARFEPDYGRLRGWLREHGRELEL